MDPLYIGIVLDEKSKKAVVTAVDKDWKVCKDKLEERSPDGSYFVGNVINLEVFIKSFISFLEKNGVDEEGLGACL